MTTTVSASDVAAELRRRVPGIGTKKLHKLLYYCQGHYLATFKAPLFADTLSAWDMGPVVGSLWHHEKECGPEDATVLMDESVLNTIGYVLNRYGALSGSDLEHLTHSEDPWLSADKDRPPGTSARIELDSIEAYFDRQTDEEDDVFVLDAGAVSRWLADTNEASARAGTTDSLDTLRSLAESA